MYLYLEILSSCFCMSEAGSAIWEHVSKTYIIDTRIVPERTSGYLHPRSLCFYTKATLFNKILSPTGNSSIKCPHKRCYNETILQTKRGVTLLRKDLFIFAHFV